MRKAEIIKQLHPFVRSDPLVNEISEVVGVNLDSFDARMGDFLRQLDIDTATWSLVLYEKELGIQTDISKPFGGRRSIIKGRLRGSGKIGAAEIKLICDSWTNGDVEVGFDGKIRIVFSSVIGMPPNMDDLKAAIEEIKPAHLAVIYSFRYLMISEAEALTISQAEATMLDKFAWG